jgi:glutaredoxin
VIEKMDKILLFSLEKCPKCTQTKHLLNNETDIDILTFPHEMEQWTEDQRKIATTYGVLENLKQTAPILWVSGEKYIGYLRIRKWIQERER